MIGDTEKRNMLFISHAWEDADFTRWLALQLAKFSYGVWCDLTKLLGGEDWPKEINQALQNRTQRFLFVLSHSSNSKSNPLGELELALSVMKSKDLRDFVIPLKIDNLPKDETDFRIQNTQWVDFTGGWTEGLVKLLALLRREQIATKLVFDPQAVNSWWSEYGTDATIVREEPESFSSNQFEVIEYPRSIFVHSFESTPNFKGFVPFPIATFSNYLLSFHSLEEMKSNIPLEQSPLESVAYPIGSFLDGTCPLWESQEEGENHLIWLLNQAFEKFLVSCFLVKFNLSKGTCYYFDKGVLKEGRIIFKGNSELSPRLKLWGNQGKSRWHFALRAKASLRPTIEYRISMHVIIHNRQGTQAASPSTTSNWRNHTWRDRLRAALLHLAQDQEKLEILRTSAGSLSLSTRSVEFICPVGYNEPNSEGETDD